MQFKIMMKQIYSWPVTPSEESPDLVSNESPSKKTPTDGKDSVMKKGKDAKKTPKVASVFFSSLISHSLYASLEHYTVCSSNNGVVIQSLADFSLNPLLLITLFPKKYRLDKQLITSDETFFSTYFFLLKNPRTKSAVCYTVSVFMRVHTMGIIQSMYFS